MSSCEAALFYGITHTALYYRLKKSKEVEDVLNAGMMKTQSTVASKSSVITRN
jgi:hypothetical protein